jgi:hypothetical protein
MRRDFDEHSDDALHLSALGRSDDPIGPYLERGGLDATTAVIFDRIVCRMARERRFRWPRTGAQFWAKTAMTFGGLAIILGAIGLLIVRSAT